MIFSRHAFFTAGFRPFFFSASLYAGLSVLLWLFLLAGYGVSLPGVENALSWHVHEMLFGYLAAVIAGFLLTAIPNWTGTPGISGSKLTIFFAVWCLGRIAIISSWPSLLAAMVDCSFLLLMAGYSWHAVISAGQKRNVVVCILLTLLAIANIGFHTDILINGSYIVSQKVALAVLLILMTVIGGRIIPTFTGNWLRQREETVMPAVAGRFDVFCIIVTVVAMFLWILFPSLFVTGTLLVANSVLQFVRLSRWRTVSVLSEPLLWILHVGYAWLSLTSLLLGAQILLPQWFPGTMGIHALTAGAAGVFPIGVMTRATLGHTGRQLSADRITVIIYSLVIIGALIRVLAPYMMSIYHIMLTVGGLTWATGFFLFSIFYGRYLFTPRQ